MIEVLRRFSNFLNLLSELKESFPRKSLPPAPPKRVLRIKSRTLLEERRSHLEDWIEKLLSDIDVSRSAPVGAFLELEAAARSALDVSIQQNSTTDSPGSVVFRSIKFENNRAGCEVTGIPCAAADDPKETRADAADTESFCGEETISAPVLENIGFDSASVNGGNAPGLGINRLFGDDLISIPDGDVSSKLDAPVCADLHFPKSSVFVLPSNERHRLSRVLNALWQRLSITRSDMEDLIARLNQETSMRKFLTTKINELEVDLETTRSSYKDNIRQSISNEKEKLTQIQWDVEDLRKQLLEADLKLKNEQRANSELESAKHSAFQKNEILQQQLDRCRGELEDSHKHREESEVKAKADVRILVKEVKSLRNSQALLKRELSCLMKEKFEADRISQKEKQSAEHRNDSNAKLLHECEVLLDRLRECSVDLVIEDESKLTVDASSPSEAVDLLATSDSRIGLLLAEAQLLAQDLEIPCAGLELTVRDADDDLRTDVKLTKMLTELCVDNAKLRMLINSVARCALRDRVDADEAGGDVDESSHTKTVLSKFL